MKGPIGLTGEEREAEIQQDMEDGRYVESPCNRLSLYGFGLGLSLVRAALWGLSDEGVVDLVYGTVEFPHGEHGPPVRPIRVSLANRPRERRTSIEGRMIEVLDGNSEVKLVKLARRALFGRWRPGKQIAWNQAHPGRAIGICRDAAIDAGLLAFCGPEDPGAAMVAANGGRKASDFVVADCAEVEKLSPEYKRRRTAYRQFTKANKGFANELAFTWTSDTSTSGTGP